MYPVLQLQSQAAALAKKAALVAPAAVEPRRPEKIHEKDRAALPGAASVIIAVLGCRFTHPALSGLRWRIRGSLKQGSAESTARRCCAGTAVAAGGAACFAIISSLFGPEAIPQISA